MIDADPFDPNTWIAEPYEFRIYGDDRASVWSVVDEIDYHFLVQWQWSIKFSKRGKKFYLRRNVQEGTKTKGRVQRTLFLHTAIMERTGIKPPSPLHTLVDHRNGDGMDCRRANLRWATPSMNRKNLFGQYAHEIIE